MRTLLALIALAALPHGVASKYLIVPGHSVGRVTLGESTPEVIATIGRPGRLGPYAGPEWIYGALQVDTDVRGLIVTGLEIVAQYGATPAQAAMYQTASGIHVGSAASAVREAYPDAQCNTKRCALTRGTRTTWFYLASGRVREIYLANH